MLLLLQLIVLVDLYKKLWAEFSRRCMIGFSKNDWNLNLHVWKYVLDVQGSASLQIHAPSFSSSGWIDVCCLN